MAQLRRDFINHLRKRDLNICFSTKRMQFLLSDSKRKDYEEGENSNGKTLSYKILELNKLIGMEVDELTIVSLLSDTTKELKHRLCLTDTEIEALQTSVHLFKYSSRILDFNHRQKNPGLRDLIIAFYYYLVYCMLPDQITGILGLSVLVSDFVSCINDITNENISISYKKCVLQLLANIGIQNPPMVGVLEKNLIDQALKGVVDLIDNECLHEEVVFLSSAIFTFGQNLKEVEICLRD